MTVYAGRGEARMKWGEGGLNGVHKLENFRRRSIDNLLWQLILVWDRVGLLEASAKPLLVSLVDAIAKLGWVEGWRQILPPSEKREDCTCLNPSTDSGEETQSVDS